ncbi:MAG TPA: response regulator [Candidatus Sulfotelmatobacter sp.]|nr:response regulator [Candidatus Sulfotelmatobacter sp.]
MSVEAPLILVVDDQMGVRRLIQEVFRGVGYRVATAVHGQEAMALCSVELPALVLLDMKMPVMDGVETLRTLRNLYPELPVIIMTAVGDGDRVSEVLSSGARSCVSKPFDVFELRQLVQQVLEEERP